MSLRSGVMEVGAVVWILYTSMWCFQLPEDGNCSFTCKLNHVAQTLPVLGVIGMVVKILQPSACV